MLTVNSETIKLIETLTLSKTKVPFLQGAPGIGKTAIGELIAKKNELRFFPNIIAQKDESEIAGIPDINSNNIYFTYKVPDWCHLANEPGTNPETNKKYKGSLIFFDEMNRASIEKMNSSLSILNERRISYNFKFNDNVYFISAGNLGEEDGTEVNELENATIDRLAVIKLQSTVKDWHKSFGKENVEPIICDFLLTYPEEFLRVPINNNTKMENFASPRSWTKLSDFFKYSCKTAKDKINMVKYLGHSFVGNSAVKLLKFMEEKQKISFKDILEAKAEETDKLLENMTKDKMNEIVQEMKSFDLSKITKTQVTNISKFVNSLYDDLKIAIIKDFSEFFITNLNQEQKEFEELGYYKILENMKDSVKQYFNKIEEEQK